MKVAFFVYPSTFQNKGGGEILLEKTEEYLLKKGVEVVRFDTWNDRIEDFDIFHVFGSVKECLPLMEVARARKVKVALESIFWSDFRRAFFEEGSLLRKSGMVARHAAKVFFPFLPSGRKKMFEASDIIFPNSENEARQISRLFNIPVSRMFVVPNGVDMSFADADPGLFTDKYGLRDFVLSVGRIEPRKNQLNLIRAMKGIDRDLVLIGDIVSGSEWYMEKCRQEAGDRVYFTGGMPHGSELLTSAYAACEVFVLPAWFETPGLAAMEAALAGAKVVATEGGSTREYFREKAIYINPDSPQDIHEKIKQALETENDGALKNLIMNTYTWDKVADRVVEGYERVLAG